MKYGVHGKGHGHFDKLHFIFYEQQREVIPDYGFARWINMELKNGGRYTKENNTFAKQTVAHNTVVVDGKTQNNGSRKAADNHWAERHFFDGNGGEVQAISARANQQYDGIEMQRTMLLIHNPLLNYPLIVDLFRIKSDAEHQYDYPIYFNGQWVTSNLKFEEQAATLQPMGAENGYEHLWQTATAQQDSAVKLTWVDGQRYYSFISAAFPGTKVMPGRIGANDPDFNLRAEQMLLLRRRAGNHLFATVVEPHGYFNEAREQSRNAHSMIQSIQVLGHNDSASVVEIKGKQGIHWRISVNNGQATDGEKTVTFDGKNYRWQGNYKLEKLAN